MPYLSVQIPVATTWPSRDDLAARNAVIAELDARHIGKSQGAGGGRGAMDFSYIVPVASDAEAVIREVFAKHLPDRDYSIRIGDA
jgi:hypothetical protein